MAIEQETYKKDIESLIRTNKVDIFFWFAGNKLDHLKKQGLISPIGKYTDEAQIKNFYKKSLLERITYNNELKLINGKSENSFVKIKDILTKFYSLKTEKCFEPDFYKKSWKEVTSLLYNNVIPMMLMGNFWTDQVPNQRRGTIKVTRFPIINEKYQFHEEAPLDIFAISHHAKKSKAMEKLILHLSDAEVLSRLNDKTKMITPHIISTQNNKDRFIYNGKKHLNRSEAFSYFFDRDTSLQVTKAVTHTLQQLMTDQISVDKVPQEFIKNFSL